MENCTTGISITTTEEICGGKYTSSSCVSIPNNITYLDVSAGDSQTTVNAALVTALMYKDEQISSLPIPDGSETKITAGTNVTVTGEGTTLAPFNISATGGALEKINEGNGLGIIIKGRDATKYGNIGLDAVDLSHSNTVSTIYGATGAKSFASGDENISSGYGSTATGVRTVTSNDFTFATGYESKATGYISNATGNDTLASGDTSHAEGQNTLASGDVSHSQNLNTEATGAYSHSQNQQTIASGIASDAGGLSTKAKGNYSFTSGIYSEANSLSESSIGMYGTNYVGSLTTRVLTDRIFNIGNGLSDVVRSDAYTLLKNGLAILPSVTNTLISAEPTGKAIITKEYLPAVSGDYANDSAAAIGGILLGQMYHTSGTVKIRLV